MNKKCAQLLIKELPGIVCHLKQNFCSPEMSQLTLQQHRLMSLLKESEMSPSRLADSLGVSLPAVSRMTVQLIDKGWLVKLSDSQDKRSCRLKVTALGKKTLESSQDSSQEKLIDLIDHLSAKEKKTLIQAFEILNKLQLSMEVTI